MQQIQTMIDVMNLNSSFDAMMRMLYVPFYMYYVLELYCVNSMRDLLECVGMTTRDIFEEDKRCTINCKYPPVNNEAVPIHMLIPS